MEFALEILAQTWAMIAEMGVYLLIGFAISALLHRVLRTSWIERLMGRKGFASILWGSVVGVPMPLCSCGVIPVTMSLRDKGASNGAAVSFLTSTPQTGIDSFLATYGMLGPVFAVYKIIVAFLSGILVGLSVELFGSPSSSSSSSSSSSPSSSGCSSGDCCGSAPKTDAQPTTAQSLRYGFLTMPADLSKSLLVGFVLAGLISALAPADLLTGLPGGWLSSVLLATAISVPLYICSTGSIPLAVALVHSGLPVSAALVLLIAGPATNVATIAAMRRVLGSRQTLIYVTGVILSAWLAALGYHYLIGSAQFMTHVMQHEMALPLWKHLGGAALLAILILSPFILRARSQNRADSLQPKRAKTMQTTIRIAGMTCSHCENSVEKGLRSLAFTQEVAVNRAAGTALLTSEEIDETAIKEKIESLGFEYQGIVQP